MWRGANLPALGGYNEVVLLGLIRRSHDPLSRVELAKRSGLSAQTVSNIVRRLLAQGLVGERGTRSTGPGKPSTMLEVIPAARFSIGVHVDPSVIGYVLTDLGGTPIARTHARTPPVNDPDSAIAEIARTVDRLILDADVDRALVLGVGVAAPGPIDKLRGVVADPPLLAGWDRVPLRDELGARLDMPVVFDKDVTAAVIGELWARDERASDDFGFFYYGAGVGFGISLDRFAVHGSSSNVGDIAHLRISDSGPVCSCGKRGCLGQNLAPATIIGDAIRAGIIDASGTSADQAAIGDVVVRIFEMAAEDARAAAILERTATALGEAIVIIANLLDLPDVVFGGPLWPLLEPSLFPRVRRVVEQSVSYVLPHSLGLSSSVLGGDTGAIGAACQVLDAAFSPHPFGLVIGSGRSAAANPAAGRTREPTLLLDTDL